MSGERDADSPPLAGIRVVDLTRLLPGPLATHHLAELGAEVIKIEGPAEQGQDDPTRHMGRSRDDIAAGRPSLAFRMLNDGKQQLRLDLREPAGRAALHTLLAGADVLVEVLRHNVLAVAHLASCGRVAAPGRDLLSGGAPCYGAYRTADGRHLAVGALELRAEVAAVFEREPLAHWTRLLDAVDCCVTPVLRLDEAQAHPLFAQVPAGG